MTNINRRNLLKSGALLAGGLPLLPSFVSALPATNRAPFKQRFSSLEQEYAAVLEADPENPMKARLLANENPFGPSPTAKKAATDALTLCYQYPFGEIGKLIKNIATHEGVKENQVLLCSGSTPLLHAAAVYYGKNNGTIVTADLTYDDLPETAAFFGAKITTVPLTAEYKYDLPTMEQKSTGAALVYICNPNNPTATTVETAQLTQFCEKVSPKVPVFVDEAYIDYMDDPAAATMIPAVKKGLPVIVARTFSKLYGLAGMRIGYIISTPEIIEKLSGYCIGPMGVSAASAAAANAGYQEKSFLKEALQKTIASRDFLYQVLKSEGYEYIPSSANFVLFPVKMESRRFAGEMMKRGVGVRSWKYRDKEWCRVSIGTMEEMKIFEKAFREIS